MLFSIANSIEGIKFSAMAFVWMVTVSLDFTHRLECLKSLAGHERWSYFNKDSIFSICVLILQAFECMLCELAPVPTAHCLAGAWSKRATQRFIELTENRKLAAKVSDWSIERHQNEKWPNHQDSVRTFSLSSKLACGACFSKVPRFFRARKASCKTSICLFWKADPLTWF